ncbi:hypothetical protein [Methylorubrum zatmanii]|uniref:Uncharacterized protein n=1 Tax=Methylorubrum zatmanii TaxID=29429 RepID=A0ABW1WWI0_9HYPH|nr:hypothetical protein [Methylorubrum zatmanii]MBD8909680.1 hypothetical protein [Methylorubrum zatmanii]
MTTPALAPEVRERPKSVDWFDIFTRAAHRSVVLPDGWIGYLSQAVEGQGVMVTGKVVTQAITRGPRKGSPNFRTADPKTERKVFVSNEAIHAEREREFLDTPPADTGEAGR